MWGDTPVNITQKLLGNIPILSYNGVRMRTAQYPTQSISMSTEV
jgi:hypothetical protein